MELKRKQNPCGGDKNLNDDNLMNEILKTIYSDLKNNISRFIEKRVRDDELRNLYKQSEYEIIYSDYIFPLVADCGMSYCPHGGSATGYILKKSGDSEKWYAEFECPRDDYFNVCSPNIEKIVDMILSDERNYIRITGKKKQPYNIEDSNMIINKSPGGALFPYYFKNGELFGAHFDG